MAVADVLLIETRAVPWLVGKLPSPAFWRASVDPPQPHSGVLMILSIFQEVCPFLRFCTQNCGKNGETSCNQAKDGLIESPWPAGDSTPSKCLFEVNPHKSLIINLFCLVNSWNNIASITANFLKMFSASPVEDLRENIFKKLAALDAILFYEFTVVFGGQL